MSVFNEQRFHDIVHLDGMQRDWFLGGPSLLVLFKHPQAHPKSTKPCSKRQQISKRLAAEILPHHAKFNTAMILEFDTDLVDLELALNWVLDCIDAGRLADVSIDPSWPMRISEAYSVLGVSAMTATRIVQSATRALREVELEEELAKEEVRRAYERERREAWKLEMTRRYLDYDLR